MVDAQTWLWVFGTIASVSGVLLGLFAIMITFGISFLFRAPTTNGSNPNMTKEALKELRWFSKWVLIPMGVFLIISIFMLSIGNSVNYNPFLFWVCVLPFVGVLIILLWLIYKFINAIIMGLAGETKPKDERKEILKTAKILLFSMCSAQVLAGISYLVLIEHDSLSLRIGFPIFLLFIVFSVLFYVVSKIEKWSSSRFKHIKTP